MSGQTTEYEWAVRAEDGVVCYSSEEVARAAVTVGGYTLGPSRSPIVAALTRPRGATEWTEFVPVADFVRRNMQRDCPPVQDGGGSDA